MTEHEIILIPADVNVVRSEAGDVIQVAQSCESNPEVVTVGIPGPPGPRGEPGNATEALLFTQNEPAADWYIYHDLGPYPTTRIYDTSGQEIVGKVVQLPGCVHVSFTAPFSGIARLI